MAILLNSPRGKGYTACCNGLPLTTNPYTSLDNIYEFYEWLDGWQQAYTENRYGSRCSINTEGVVL